MPLVPSWIESRVAERCSSATVDPAETLGRFNLGVSRAFRSSHSLCSVAAETAVALVASAANADDGGNLPDFRFEGDFEGDEDTSL
jgi:hypothetical protein